MLISKRRGKSEHENCLQTSEGLSHRPEVRPFCIDQEFGTRTKAYFLLIRNANSRWSILFGGDSDHWRCRAEVSNQDCMVQWTAISLCDQIDLDPNPSSSACHLCCLGHFTFLRLVSSSLNSLRTDYEKLVQSGT